jgi:hypothetical protein
MPPVPYPDFRWFFRTIRVVPVVAVAALAGGIIGGFSVFAIDLAVTAPPNHNIPAEPGSKLASEATNDNAVAVPAPMRTFDAATPTATAPAASSAPPVASNSNIAPVSEPAPVSARYVPQAQPVPAAATATQSDEITVVHPQTIQPVERSQGTIAAAPAERTSWPDALSREHNTAPSEATPGVNPAVTAAPNQPHAIEAAHAQTAPQPATVQTAEKPETKTQTLKRRVAIKRPLTPNERADETASGNARPLYDGYSRQDSRQDNRQDDADRAEHRTARPQYAVRRAPPVDIEQSSDRADGRLYDRLDDGGDDDNGDGLPAQPSPPRLPFFGLFGGGNNN